MKGAIDARVLADTIEDGMHTLAFGDLQHPLNDVLVFVKDDMVCAVALCESRLLLRRCRTDYDRSALFQQLRELQAETTSNGMHEDVIPFLYIVCLRNERERGQPLSKDACSRSQGDRLGDREDLGPRDARIFGE